jgi:hypothetical protein
MHIFKNLYFWQCLLFFQWKYEVLVQYKYQNQRSLMLTRQRMNTIIKYLQNDKLIFLHQFCCDDDRITIHSVGVIIFYFFGVKLVTYTHTQHVTLTGSVNPYVTFYKIVYVKYTWKESKYQTQGTVFNLVLFEKNYTIYVR